MILEDLIKGPLYHDILRSGRPTFRGRNSRRLYGTWPWKEAKKPVHSVVNAANQSEGNAQQRVDFGGFTLH